MKTELTIKESAKLIELGVDANLASSEYIGRSKTYSNGTFADTDSIGPIFTLTDILSILPKEIELGDRTENLNIVMDNCGALVGYPLIHKTHGAAFVKTELIDSLYQLLIWCLENGHLKTEKK